MTNGKENEGNEDYGFDDDIAEYSLKSDFSKAKVAEEATKKCIDARGKEMKAGYYNTKLTKDGQPIRTWVEDYRQIYIGTVIALRNLLSPEIKNNKNCKQSLKKLDEDKKKIFDSYCYTEKIQEINKIGRLVWKDDSRKMIPEIDDVVVVKNPGNPSMGLRGKGHWNLYVNAYWNDLVDVYDKIFATLNNLIDSLNYFKQKSSF